MSESATSERAPDRALERAHRHAQTVRRIVAAARRLALDHGPDGFTMDDLAAATGVSRRTLFNHVAGKDDAVLGPFPDLPEEAVADFVAGRPHGHLVDDLTALAARVIQSASETPEEVALGRAVVEAYPRLHQLAMRRISEVVESSIGLVAEREGAAYDRARFDLALALLVACLEVAMDRYLTGEHGDDLGVVLVTTVRSARDLLT